MTYTGTSPILSQGRATGAQIERFMAIIGTERGAGLPPPAGVGDFIIRWSRAWGGYTVNHDLVAALITHESAGWNSPYARERNNPSGLGAINSDPDQAIRFPSPGDGIAATVAHLLDYAVGFGPWASVDPRYDAVLSAGWLGKAPTLNGLNGKWAFPGNGYGEAIAALANRLLTTEEPMQAEIPGFTFVPETAGEFGYPPGTHGRNGRTIDRLIIHYTDGTDSLDWLTGAHGNSVHFLTERDGTPRAQMILLADAAWGAGNQEYNERGVQLEIERLSSEARSWPDALLENVARIAADICKAVPTIKPDREHIIGHNEVPDPNNPGRFGGRGNHTDPGGFFPWPNFIHLVQRFMGLPDPVDQPPTLPQTMLDPWGSPYRQGLWVPYPFVDYINQHGFMAVGYVLTPAEAVGKQIVQWFERARLEYHVDGSVTAGLIGLELLQARGRKL